jgi:hypothetical protein
LKGAIESLTGTVESKGILWWSAEGAVRIGLDVALRDMSVASELGSIDRLNAAIHLDGPRPLSTPAKQQISMAEIDFGLPLHNGLIEMQLRRDGLLDISSAEWALAGGKVRTSGRFDPRATTQSLVLDLVDLDLTEVLKLVDLSGLSGSGKLNGRLPVTRRGSTVEIRNGVLAGTPEGGWIRYAPDAGMASAATQQEDLNIVLAALRNFRYREISITLDGDTEGPVDVAIHLAGANPDYLAGHPVEFNLNVNSYLVDLLRKASAGYRIPQQIEKNLKKISEGHR